jgi:hypothetical protein
VRWRLSEGLEELNLVVCSSIAQAGGDMVQWEAARVVEAERRDLRSSQSAGSLGGGTSASGQLQVGVLRTASSAWERSPTIDCNRLCCEDRRDTGCAGLVPSPV